MTRTLVISDMHIGAYAGHSVLELAQGRAALSAALEGFDRLVLLGDALELGEGRPGHEVLDIATPTLAELGRRVREIVWLPGNHDRMLIRPWLLAQDEHLALENTVPLDASPLLQQVTDIIGSGGASLAVHYPGFRFSETIWMTHGHYLDRLLVPDGPYGLFRRPVKHRPAAYESRQVLARRPSALKYTRRLLNPRLSRFTSGGLDMQMRRHSLPALVAILSAFGVRSEYVVFGHVHRLGPLAGDRPADWEHVLGHGTQATRFLNTGSWQYERLLVAHGRPTHPYWPGGSVVIEDDGIPRAVNQLDGLELDLDGAAWRRPQLTR